MPKESTIREKARPVAKLCSSEPARASGTTVCLKGHRMGPQGAFAPSMLRNSAVEGALMLAFSLRSIVRHNSFTASS